MLAQLAWTRTAIDEKAKFGQKEVQAEFTFVNQGSEAVTITKTETSCGCTVANLEKKTYEPGEEGTLGVIFDVGQRVGKQVKRIQVNTDESNNAEGYKLVLSVDIPQAIELKPRVLTWRRGSEATTKEIHVTFHDELPLALHSIVPQNDDAQNFSYEIVEREINKIYTIRITPKDMAVQSRGRHRLSAGQDSDALLSRHLIYTFLR